MNKNIKKNLLDSSNTITDALKLLEFSFYKVIIVKNKKNQVIGTVTDGDIRRTLIKNINTDLPISKIMNKKPVLASSGTNNLKILELMKLNSVKQIPIVDNLKRLTDIKSIDDILVVKEKRNSVFIMAGGMGKRLRPLTNKIPRIRLTGKKAKTRFMNK